METRNSKARKTQNYKGKTDRTDDNAEELTQVSGTTRKRTQKQQNQLNQTPQAQSPPPTSPAGKNTNAQRRQATERVKWTTEEYKEIIWCYWYIKESTQSCNINANYDLWRKRNPNTRPHIDANKLATQRRFIAKNQKLSEAQIEEIKADVAANLATQCEPGVTRKTQNTNNNQNSPTTMNNAANHTQRVQWTEEEYKEVIWCHWFVKENTGIHNIKATYELWRQRNPNARLHLNANKLATQRRYIENKKKLTEQQLQEIKDDVHSTIEASTDQHTTESSPGDATNDENRPSRRNDPTDTRESESTPNIPQTNETPRRSKQLRIPSPEPEHETTPQEQNTASTLETTTSTSKLRSVYQEVLEMNLEEREPIRKIKGAKKDQEIIMRTNNEVQNMLESEENLDLWKINCLLYAAALTISDESNGPKGTKMNKKESKPLWQKRIEFRIQDLRRNLSVLANFKITSKEKGQQTTHKVQSILDKYTAEGEESSIDNVMEQLRQRIAVFSQRIRRYQKRSNQFSHNRSFETNCKSFYRNIKGDSSDIGETPEKEKVEEFWKGIYEVPTQHNSEAGWIKDSEVTNNKMEWTDLGDDELITTIKNLANWKAPGPDKIQSFWFKKIPSIHKYLTAEYNKLLNGKEFPPWLAKGTTYLIAKNRETANPKNYRPITCLNIAYKIFTALMAGKTYKYLESAKLLPIEQKGCRKGAKGCLDQLLISKTIIEDCRKNKKNLSIAWLDYQKAFDSMPHSWIIRALELMGVHPNIVNACKNMMEHWSTCIQLRGKTDTIITSEIKIRRGIYQGDAFSPLLFCVGLIPLSTRLNNMNNGYNIKAGHKQLTHLLYMDDLKLFSSSDEKLQNQLETVKEFSDDIGMKFGLDKCAKVTFKKGKYIHGENMDIDVDTSIRQLDPGETYKYLGMEESIGIQHKTIKEKVKREYIRRVRAVLKTELTAKNKITAIGALAVPVLQYGFAILNWKIKEIKALDIKTRKCLTMHKMHHPSADVDRLYVSRKLGGRGLRQIESTYKSSIINAKYYLQEKKNEDPFLKAVYAVNLALDKDHIAKEANKFEAELGENFEVAPINSRKQKIKKKISESIRTKWKGKIMHGQYPLMLENDSIESNLSTIWLSKGVLKAETESLIVAAQDQALNTRYRERKIHKKHVNSKCRICHQFEETIEHITSGCPILAQKDYIERHDRVCTQLHYSLCKEYGIEVDADKWYEHKPKNTATTRDGETTILWNFPIRTDRTVEANRPDIILRRKGQTCLLIDVSIPADRNITKKEAEKKLKYKDLEIEISRMWKTKTRVIPFVIGATGAVSKDWTKLKNEIPGKHSLVLAQKSAVLGTARILRKVLS